MALEQQHPSQALEAVKQQVEKHLTSSTELQDPVAMKKLLEHYVDKVKKFQDQANDMRTKLGTDASNPENAKTLQKLHDAEEQLAMLLRHGVDTKLLSSSHAQEFSNHVDRFLEELAQAQQAPHRPRFLLSGLTPEGERQLKEEQAIKHRWETAKREMQLCVDLPYPQNNDRASGILDTAKSLINEEPQSGAIPEDLVKRAEACVQALREVFPLRDRMAWKAVSERAQKLLKSMQSDRVTENTSKLAALESKGDLKGYAEAVERMHLEALRDEKRPQVQESLSKLGKPEDLLPSAAATERMHTLLPHAEKMYEDAAKLFPSDSPELRAIQAAITEADSALEGGGAVSKAFVQHFVQTLETNLGHATKEHLRQRSALLNPKRLRPRAEMEGDVTIIQNKRFMKGGELIRQGNLFQMEERKPYQTTYFSSDPDKYGSTDFYTAYAKIMGNSPSSEAMKQAAMKDAALAVRLSLERTSQALNHAGPLKDTPDAKELQERFAQEGKRFVELAGGFEPSSSGEVLNPTEAGAAAKAVASHMSAQEIFTWMTALNAKVQHFTSGERRAAQQAVFAGCEEALFPKLEQMRVEGANNPEARRAHALLCRNIAIALRPIDTPNEEAPNPTLIGNLARLYRFDDRFTNGELAIAAAQSAMRYDEVAFRFAEKKMNFPVRAKIEAEAQAVLGEWGTFLVDLPSEKREAIEGDAQVRSMMEIVQSDPVGLEGLAARYTVIEQMRASMRNEDPGPRREAVRRELEQAFGDGKLYREAFQEFLTSGFAKTPEQINAAIGDPPLSPEQAKAFTLLGAMEGHGYALSDKTIGYIQGGGKIAGMIGIGIFAGTVTGGLGLGAIAAILSEAAIITTASVVIEGKGFEGGVGGFLQAYAPEFALNAATGGIGRGLRGAGAMITEAAPGAVVKTSVVASEAALNTLSGAALQTALIGGDFGDNLVQCAAFAGIPIGLEAGGALRVRFKTHMEIRRAKAGLQLLASDAAALEQACKEAGVNFKKVHTVKDGEALSRLLAGNPHTERVTSTFEAFNTSRGKLQGILETAAAQAGGIDVADLTTIAREAKANPAQVLALKEILKRTEVDEATRLSLAESVLGRTLLDEEKAAVIKAHRKGGTIDNVTRAELKDKIEVLKRAFRDDAERRLLIESGICGNPAQNRIAMTWKEAAPLLENPDGRMRITGIDPNTGTLFTSEFEPTVRNVNRTTGTTQYEFVNKGTNGPPILFPSGIEELAGYGSFKLEPLSPPRTTPSSASAAAPARPSAAPSVAATPSPLPNGIKFGDAVMYTEPGKPAQRLRILNRNGRPALYANDPVTGATTIVEAFNMNHVKPAAPELPSGLQYGDEILYPINGRPERFKIMQKGSKAVLFRNDPVTGDTIVDTFNLSAVRAAPRPTPTQTPPPTPPSTPPAAPKPSPAPVSAPPAAPQPGPAKAPAQTPTTKPPPAPQPAPKSSPAATPAAPKLSPQPPAAPPLLARTMAEANTILAKGEHDVCVITNGLDLRGNVFSGEYRREMRMSTNGQETAVYKKISGNGPEELNAQSISFGFHENRYGPSVEFIKNPTRPKISLNPAKNAAPETAILPDPNPSKDLLTLRNSLKSTKAKLPAPLKEALQYKDKAQFMGHFVQNDAKGIGAGFNYIDRHGLANNQMTVPRDHPHARIIDTCVTTKQDVESIVTFPGESGKTIIQYGFATKKNLDTVGRPKGQFWITVELPTPLAQKVVSTLQKNPTSMRSFFWEFADMKLLNEYFKGAPPSYEPYPLVDASGKAANKHFIAVSDPSGVRFIDGAGNTVDAPMEFKRSDYVKGTVTRAPQFVRQQDGSYRKPNPTSATP